MPLPAPLDNKVSTTSLNSSYCFIFKSGIKFIAVLIVDSISLVLNPQLFKRFSVSIIKLLYSSNDSKSLSLKL